MSYHSDMMAEYYAIREYEEQQAEQWGYGYDAETQEFWEKNPRTTFKSFLRARKAFRDEFEHTH